MKKKLIIFLICCIFSAVVIAFTVICVALNISVDTVVADVDGMKIYAGEVKLHMNEIKTDVIEYFEQNYSVTAGNDFWDTEFDGVTPAEYLRNEALSASVRCRLELELGVEYGIVKDASYDAFVDEMKEVNSVNQSKIDNGEPIYGQSEYSESTYHMYRMSNLRIELQEVMGQEGEPLYGDEAALKAFYYANRDQNYRRIDNCIFKILKSDDMQALKAAEKIIADENEPLSKLTDVEITQTELSNSNYKQLSKENSAFYDTIYSLSEGETAYFGENTLIWCFSRSFSGYESYSSVESTVIAEYRQQQYEKYINELVKNSSINTYSKLDKIPLSKPLA
ncbi:MAG: hypothetical protein U0L48_08805 [Acutalibacteraceae bacterium]|nr:hypothetical protein [Acutalibacteraceae bacterium]